MNDSDLLKIIADNLKKNDKFIIIRNKYRNIIFPKSNELINEIERLCKNKINGMEFYDKESKSYYIKKTTMFYINNEPYIFELIENNNKYKKIEQKSKYDLFTKLLNKDSILEIIDNTILSKNKTITSLSLSVCDIDDFKNINDTYTHLGGDVILQRIAEIFRRYENEHCSIGRFGGDEFVFLFKNISSDKVLETIYSIKNEIEQLRIAFHNYKISNITMSFGIYAIDDYEEFHYDNLNQIIEERKRLFRLADEALYQSKNKGKNMITLVNKKN